MLLFNCCLFSLLEISHFKDRWKWWAKIKWWIEKFKIQYTDSCPKGWPAKQSDHIFGIIRGSRDDEYYEPQHTYCRQRKNTDIIYIYSCPIDPFTAFCSGKDYGVSRLTNIWMLWLVFWTTRTSYLYYCSISSLLFKLIC